MDKRILYSILTSLWKVRVNENKAENQVELEDAIDKLSRLLYAPEKG